MVVVMTHPDFKSGDDMIKLRAVKHCVLLTRRSTKTTSLTPMWLQSRREHKQVPKRLNVHVFRKSCWILACKWGQ